MIPLSHPHGLAARFRHSASGSIAIIAAFSLFIVVGAIGLCIDGGRAYTVRLQLQAAVDAAVLASARRLSEDPSADYEAVFRAFFDASFGSKHASEVTGVTLHKTDTMVEGTVNVRVPTTFMQIVSYEQVSIGSTARAQFGMDEAEVILALDNTGSMAGAKMTALKDAASSLVDTLHSSSPAPGKIRIGVVPFARYVNIGTGHRTASWMDVPADYTETVSGCYDTYPNAVSSNCRMQSGTCYNDGIPYSCSYQVCDWDYGSPVNVCSTWTNSYTWTGCVRSRAYPLNLQDSNYATRIPGVLNASCPTAITPLTESRSDVVSAIDAMSANDDTYIPEGLMWAWRALSTQAPFDESRQASVPRLTRYIVLMTDGANTVSPQAADHYGTDTALANQYTREACTNIKGDNVKIFTIAFDVTDTSIKDILQSCASGAGFYYDATDAAGLSAAFNSIAAQISGLRLTQ